MPLRHALPLATCLAVLALPSASQGIDATRRIAIVSAFEPEWQALTAALDDAATHEVNGNRFVTGNLEGREVLLFLSGISMVNAAMTTQMALDRFNVRGLVVSGIAGGVDPELGIGDVVVPARWGQYLEHIYARETGGTFSIPPWMSSDFAPFGMMYTRNTEIVSSRRDGRELRFWFPVDRRFLKAAEAVAAEIDLADCVDANACLDDPPQVITGGSGVSGAAFVDNAEFRAYVHQTFDASVLDMETAAVAHVAYANRVPFIAFRSLSDLAGGGEGANEMQTFLALAADNSAAVVRAFLAELD